MPEQRETYKRRELVVKTDDNGPQLYIDGEHIVAVRDEDSGVWTTLRLGYRDYPSLVDLAKALIDET